MPQKMESIQCFSHFQYCDYYDASLNSGFGGKSIELKHDGLYLTCGHIDFYLGFENQNF